MKHICTVDGGSQPDCVFDNGPMEDCSVACRLWDSGKGKADCEHWKPESPESEDAAAIWERKFREVVRLTNEALDLVEPAFDAGLNGEHGIEQSEAREAIRTQLEALEKNA